MKTRGVYSQLDNQEAIPLPSGGTLDSGRTGGGPNVFQLPGAPLITRKQVVKELIFITSGEM